jgi:hypothetical protein
VKRQLLEITGFQWVAVLGRGKSFLQPRNARSLLKSRLKLST